MLAVLVVLTSTVEWCTSAVYVGEVPEAEHENSKPGNARTKEADKSTLGDAIESKKYKTMSGYTALFYAMLSYGTLCCAYAMLCYPSAMLWYAMLCHAMLCYAMLSYTMLCYDMLFCAMCAKLCYAKHVLQV